MNAVKKSIGTTDLAYQYSKGSSAAQWFVFSGSVFEHRTKASVSGFFERGYFWRVKAEGSFALL